MLRSVVATAAEDCMRYRRLQDEIERTSRMFGLMSNALFRFKTLAQARELASLLANACPNPRKAVIGISELLVNAVEHGNLGIGYDEKGMLLQSGQLDQEVQRRLELPEYRDLDVDVCYERTEKEIRISITDQGEGFDWRSFSNMAPERVFDAHGRGIAVARIMSFDQLEFFGEGNQVKGVIRLLE
jgi:anti-sigma regulatory factor (Ser/Thr protein kinase)